MKKYKPTDGHRQSAFLAPDDITIIEIRTKPILAV